MKTSDRILFRRSFLRYIIIRARNSLSAGAILRPLLGKYFVDLAQAVVCYSGTLQVVRSNASVASIGQRTLTVMNQSQYNGKYSEFKIVENENTSI